MTNDPFSNDQAPSTPPGWYPDESGQQRYWDGEAWTDHVQGGNPAVPQHGASMVGAPTDDDRTMAALGHGLAIVAGFLAPLIIMLVKGDKSTFVKYHSVEALNFTITLMIGYVVASVLIVVLIGIILIPLIWIVSVVFHIMAAMAANRGEYYRYPFNIRLIPGPTV